MSIENLQVTELLPTENIHTATIIFFHGLGESGDNLKEWIRFILCRDFNFSNIKIIFPTAPRQPFSIFDGLSTTIWFDVNGKKADINLPEKSETFLPMYKLVDQIIQNEIKIGIPLNRIIVGGFSMGGVIAIHLAYHVYNNLAGVFVFSSFLNNDSVVYKSLQKSNNLNKEHPTKLLWMHGDEDELLLYKSGQIVYDKLCKHGVKGEFHTLSKIKHEITMSELLYFEQWVIRMLSSSSSPNSLSSRL